MISACLPVSSSNCDSAATKKLVETSAELLISPETVHSMKIPGKTAHLMKVSGKASHLVKIAAKAVSPCRNTR